MGRITNLIPLLSDSHTFACKLAIPPDRMTEKPSQHSMLFLILAKNVECWDGLRRGEEHGEPKHRARTG